MNYIHFDYAVGAGTVGGDGVVAAAVAVDAAGDA